MRRSARNTLKALVVSIGITAFALTATGCAEEDTTALRQVQPPAYDPAKGIAGSYVSVFIDGWNNDGDEGDQAEIEKKAGLNDTWVIPNEAAYRPTKQGDFKVELRLYAADPKTKTPPVWKIINLNGTPVGYDHDNCQGAEELYAAMATKNVMFDKNESPNGDGSNDDCVKGGEPDSESKH